jgi:hypothetical protein
MDLVAGAAVLVGWIGIAGFNLGKVLTGGNHSAESSARMAACAGIARTFFDEGYTGTMQGLFPGSFLACDDGCVIVALGAGHILYVELP